MSEQVQPNADGLSGSSAVRHSVRDAACQSTVSSSSDFTQSFDAVVWAEAFVSHVRANPEIATDEGTMIGWFANALMRGYDERSRASDACDEDTHVWAAVAAGTEPAMGTPCRCGERGWDGSELAQAEAYIDALRAPLLWHFGTTDPELLTEVWARQAKPLP